MRRCPSLLLAGIAFAALHLGASAQAPNDTFRVIHRLSPMSRVDSALGQAPDWGGQPPPGGLTARLVYVEDGDGGHYGCVPPSNAAALAGNIAFIGRGACEFGLKALHAQNAGAIAFIVHECKSGSKDCSDPACEVFMGAGALGHLVTIPGAFMVCSLAWGFGGYVELVEDTSNVVMVTMEPVCEPGPCVVAAEPGPPVEAHRLQPARPNPFTISTAFGLRLSRPEHVRLEVLDPLGRRVALLHDGVLAAGDVHAFTLEATGLPGGVYLYRAAGGTFVETRSVVLMR